MRFLHKIILIFIIAMAFLSCTKNNEIKEPVWSDLPTVTNLDSLKQTEFVATLENTITENKNIIYSPTLLFAWDKIKSELNSNITLNKTQSEDFKLLNQSNSYKNSLLESEYTADVKIDGNNISVKTFFNKTLPFPIKLDKLYDSIIFNEKKVASFGMKSFDYEKTTFTKLLYYKSDDEFILKFIPKDSNEEIILSKGLNPTNTLTEAVKQVNELIEKGKIEKKDTNLLWKYYIIEKDVFSIPMLKLNIEKNYKNIENQLFLSGSNSYKIVKAYQRTGFILNENGAAAEGEASMETLSMALAEENIQKPKKLIFDKPFIILMRNIKKSNPYFVMKVDNTELMIK